MTFALGESEREKIKSSMSEATEAIRQEAEKEMEKRVQQCKNADIEADVIVIGSHGHSGQRRMLGTTANKLLHGAKSDILTVHAGDAT